MTRRIIAGVVASVVLLAGTHHRDPYAAEKRCAQSLNVEWSRAQGATERLTAFAACVEQALRAVEQTRGAAAGRGSR